MILDQNGNSISVKEIEILDTSEKLDKYFRSQGWSTIVAGINVTPETALKVPAVLACLQVISQSLSMLPFTVYKKTDDSRKKFSDNDVYKRLKLQPNRFQSAVEFIRTMTFNAAWQGNSYAIKNKSRRRLFELIPLEVGRCEPEMQSNGRLVYKVKSVENGSQVVTDYDQDDIFHLRGLLSTRKPWKGDSPILEGKNAIATALAAEKFGGDYFSDGAKSQGGFKLPDGVKSLTDEAFYRLKNELNAASNSHQRMLLEHGLEYFAMSHNPQDAQLNELRDMQVYEICRLYRIQPHMIHALSKATFSNIEHQAREFIDHTLMPWIRQWESAVLTQLMDPLDESVYPKFSVSALLRGDTKSRIESIFKACGVPFMTINEARSIEDMDPVDDGDELYTPLNMGKQSDPPDPPPPDNQIIGADNDDETEEPEAA